MKHVDKDLLPVYLGDQTRHINGSGLGVGGWGGGAYFSAKPTNLPSRVRRRRFTRNFYPTISTACGYFAIFVLDPLQLLKLVHSYSAKFNAHFLFPPPYRKYQIVSLNSNVFLLKYCGIAPNLRKICTSKNSRKSFFKGITKCLANKEQTLAKCRQTCKD